MIKTLKNCILTILSMYKETFEHTLKLLKLTKNTIRRKREIDYLMNIQDHIKKYLDKAASYHAKAKLCNPKDAERLLIKAHRYEYKATTLKSLFDFEYEKYYQKYYGGETK